MALITKEDFLKMVKESHLEVLSKSQMHTNTSRGKELLQKANQDTLSKSEESEAMSLLNDIGEFTKWEVLRSDFSKAILYTRPKQIDWEEAETGEFGEIIKAKAGTYTNTSENRKKGRVGQKYGSEKELSLPGKDKKSKSEYKFSKVVGKLNGKHAVIAENEKGEKKYFTLSEEEGKKFREMSHDKKQAWLDKKIKN